MEKIKPLLLMLLVVLSFTIGSLLTTTTPVTTGVGQAIPHGGGFLIQHIRNGEVIFSEYDSNVLTTLGANMTAQKMLNVTGMGAFNYVALGNGTDPDTSTIDEELNAEINDSSCGSCGLTPTVGTIQDAGTTGNYSVTHLFTYTGPGSQVVNSTALYNATTGGMFIADDFTDRTLETNDQINITAYFWVT